jgi:hypothetical protein
MQNAVTRKSQPPSSHPLYEVPVGYKGTSYVTKQARDRRLPGSRSGFARIGPRD